MANRYWIGGTGTWNATSTTNWSAIEAGDRYGVRYEELLAFIIAAI